MTLELPEWQLEPGGQFVELALGVALATVFVAACDDPPTPEAKWQWVVMWGEDHNEDFSASYAQAKKDAITFARTLLEQQAEVCRRCLGVDNVKQAGMSAEELAGLSAYVDEALAWFAEMIATRPANERVFRGDIAAYETMRSIIRSHSESGRLR